MDNALLQINKLKTYFFTNSGIVRAVDNVSFVLRKGECLCLVGESGCGKTATALSILRLVDIPPGKITGGEILYHGEDLISCSKKRLRQLRGNRIAMIFQDPQSSLNPVLTIGDQIAESLRWHRGLNRRSSLGKAVQLMAKVGIPRAEERIKNYPHQFSGGMKQRAMIATALACDPEILIADEPTTALDTTIKSQILDIFQELKQQRQMSILFITHDLGTVAGIADRVIVMYGGRIAESGTTQDIFDDPKHPYTHGLLDCLPTLHVKKERLTPIPGTIPSLIGLPEGCIFSQRCPKRMLICGRIIPGEIFISREHSVACHLYSTPNKNKENSKVK